MNVRIGQIVKNFFNVWVEQLEEEGEDGDWETEEELEEEEMEEEGEDEDWETEEELEEEEMEEGKKR